MSLEVAGSKPELTPVSDFKYETLELNPLYQGLQNLVILLRSRRKGMAHAHDHLRVKKVGDRNQLSVAAPMSRIALNRESFEKNFLCFNIVLQLQFAGRKRIVKRRKDPKP